jgi:hypothetical protein
VAASAYNVVVRPITLAFFLIAVSCSSPPVEQPKSTATPKAPAHEPPKDHSTKLPAAGQIRSQLVADHLLGKDFMPGGNLADYKTDLTEYQIFVLEAADARAAAFLLLDWKTAIPDAKYLAHMGGYYGTDQGKPIYVFAKGPYLAGIVGLPEAKADPEARRLAAKL